MRLKKVIKMFERGSVCVCGLVGRGKDMLLANVIVRRSVPYVSNTEYDDKGLFIPFRYEDFSVGGNNYKNFIAGNLRYYDFPFQDGTDLYLADVGVYFPSQYCSDLNKYYPNIPTFVALSRHLGKCSVHFNVQNLNRCWDKIREMSDTYINCNGCKVLWGKVVIQKITIYEKYQSCVDRVPPYRIPCPWFNSDRILRWKMDKQNYFIAHGKIRSRWLLYINRSSYDTRVFKGMLLNGEK